MYIAHPHTATIQFVSEIVLLYPTAQHRKGDPHPGARKLLEGPSSGNFGALLRRLDFIRSGEDTNVAKPIPP